VSPEFKFRRRFVWGQVMHLVVESLLIGKSIESLKVIVGLVAKLQGTLPP